MFELNISDLLPLRYVCGGHFISDGEWIHKERIRDDYELIFVVEGVLKIAIENTAYTISPMEGIILPPFQRHYGTESTDKQISFYWIHFIPSDNGNHKLEQNHFKVVKPEQFLQLFRYTLHISSSMQYMREAVNYATSLLLLELQAQLRMAEHINHPKLNEICEWIRLHPREPGSVSGLASRFGFNQDYLCRLFKSAFGVTLKQYISKSKLEQAKILLLTTSLPVKQVAEMVGISDEKVFYKFFKLHEGITPSRFRNSFANVLVNME